MKFEVECLIKDCSTRAHRGLWSITTGPLRGSEYMWRVVLYCNDKCLTHWFYIKPQMKSFISFSSMFKTTHYLLWKVVWILKYKFKTNIWENCGKISEKIVYNYRVFLKKVSKNYLQIHNSLSYRWKPSLH